MRKADAVVTEGLEALTFGANFVVTHLMEVANTNKEYRMAEFLKGFHFFTSLIWKHFIADVRKSILIPNLIVRFELNEIQSAQWHEI